MSDAPATDRPADEPSALDRWLLVTDVDSTLITGEVIEMLAAHAGTRAAVAEVTERAMAGELDFTASLHARVATLAGLPVSVLAQVVDEVELSPGAELLCAQWHARGWPVGLVSGGFTEVVGPLAARLGVTFHRANGLEVVDGVLTGRVRGPVIDRAAKAETLRELAGTLGIPLSRTVAVGDGANDLEMLDVAQIGIAFNAKPVVSDRADLTLTGSLAGVLDVVDAYVATGVVPTAG